MNKNLLLVIFVIFILAAISSFFGLSVIASMLWFALGIVLVTKGADIAVDESVVVARGLGVSPMIIGLTLISFGTSLPELSVSVIASLFGNSGISIGNVVGSNIANIGLIIGLTSVIRPLMGGLKDIKKESIIMIISSFLILVLCFLTGSRVLGVFDGIVFLVLFFVFLYATVRDAEEGKLVHGAKLKKRRHVTKSLVMLFIGIGVVLIGADMVVNNGSSLARMLGISEAIIGLTMIAVGTSLPELATNVAAVAKKRSDIAIGNIIGSNIFNLLFILGVASILRPIAVPMRITNIDIPLMILLSILLIIFIKTGNAVSKKEGSILLLIYIIYILWIAMNVLHIL